MSASQDHEYCTMQPVTTAVCHELYKAWEYGLTPHGVKALGYKENLKQLQ